MNTYNLKLSTNTINKLSSDKYRVKGYNNKGNILIELKPRFSKEFNKVLDIIRPLSADEQLELLKELTIDVEQTIDICNS